MTATQANATKIRTKIENGKTWVLMSDLYTSRIKGNYSLSASSAYFEGIVKTVRKNSYNDVIDAEIELTHKEGFLAKRHSLFMTLEVEGLWCTRADSRYKISISPL